MTDEEKIWQLFFVTPEAITNVNTATVAGETTKKALEQYPVGGIVYFAKNLEDREQTVALLENTQSYAKIPLFLGVDEEGGTVSRVGSNEALGGTNVGRMQSYGEEAAEEPAEESEPAEKETVCGCCCGTTEDAPAEETCCCAKPEEAPAEEHCCCEKPEQTPAEPEDTAIEIHIAGQKDGSAE